MSSILISGCMVGLGKMLEWLLGQFAKLLCFHTGVQIPFFPKLLIKHHIIEIKYRIIYLIISFLITFIIIIYNIDIIILIFSPHVKSFILFSNFVDSIFLHFSAAFSISILLEFPYIIYSLWSYIRPGLLKYEDVNIYFLPLFWLFPIFFYFCFLSFYNFCFFDLTIHVDLFYRYVPTLPEIVRYIKNSINISLVLTLIIYIIIYYNIINIKKYIFYRFHIYFLNLIIISFFLPPDLFILIFAAIFIIIILELLFFLILFFSILLP